MEGEATETQAQCTGQKTMSTSTSFRLRSPSLNSLRLRRIFDMFDRNNDGMITVDELNQPLNLLGLETDLSELDSMIRSYIKDGNVGLTFEDFEALHRSLDNVFFGPDEGGDGGEEAISKAQEEAEMREAFRVFDEDGNGFISARELQTVLTKLGLLESGGNEIDRVEQMIASYDQNRDGLVDFNEFKDMMRVDDLPLSDNSSPKMKKRQKSVAATDLKALIHESSVFFENLVNLIPLRFYLSSDDSKPWFQGLSNLKLARRNRLDPDKKIAQSSTLENTDDSDKDKPIDFGEEDDGNDRSVTYEEWRQRLLGKIEALRGNRGAGERSERKGSGKDGNSVNSEVKKRKRNSEKTGNVLSEIEFGKVKIGDGAKAKELERLKRLEEAKEENPKVKAAADRAMGVKVHDNPRLLKESMKRVESREKLKEERQQKRRDNISGRIHEKKIAQREKKLMRPGFEGRKEEFITKD
nr:ribosomal RNA-processing protein 14-C-like [Ipomoea batatas]